MPRGSARTLPRLDEPLFRPMQISVWGYLVAYSAVYFWMEAPLVAWTLLIGAVIITPVQFIFNSRGYPVLSRTLFCIACLLYVFSAGVGLPAGIFAETYYLVAIMVPNLLFNREDPFERQITRMCTVLPSIAWFIHWKYPDIGIPSDWLPGPDFPVTVFAMVNLTGASALMVIFLNIFIRKVQLSLRDLAKSKQQTDEAQAAARIGSWSFDPASGKISWSRQLFVLYEMSEEQGEPTFENLLKTVHPEDVAHYRATVEKCLKDGKPYLMRFRSVLKDRVLWLEGYGQGAYDSNGIVVGLHGTCQDITERLQTEETLKIERAKGIQNAKLASLGEMSAGVAHEINNPLAIIASSLALISKRASLNPQQADWVERSLRATDRISKIVTALRKFSRSSERSARSTTDVVQILQEVAVLTEVRAKEHGASLNISHSESAFWVNCNVVELEQVLINLINNAVDAVMAEPVRNVGVTLSRDGDVCVIRVTDSGPGVPAHVLEKLFNPFFTTKPVGVGTGLGLSIVRGIVEDHGGTVEYLAHSRPTCFEVRWPLASTQSLSAKAG